MHGFTSYTFGDDRKDKMEVDMEPLPLARDGGSQTMMVKVRRFAAAIGGTLAIASGGTAVSNAINNDSGDGIQPASTPISLAVGAKLRDIYTRNPEYIKGNFGGAWEHLETQINKGDGNYHSPKDIEEKIIAFLGNGKIAGIGILLIFLGIRLGKLKIKEGTKFDHKIEGNTYTTLIDKVSDGGITIIFTNQTTRKSYRKEVSQKSLQSMIDNINSDPKHIFG